MSTPLPTRVLNEFKRQAELTAQRMTQFYQLRRLKSWEDIEKTFQISIDSVFKAKEFTYSNFSAFRELWKNSVEVRLQQQLSRKAPEVAKIKVVKETSTFGEITLYPEQQGCYEAITDALFIGKTRPIIKVAIQEGVMGSGKTHIAAAVCNYLFDIKKILNDPMSMLKLHPVMIFTPKGVVETWRRILVRHGLGEYVNNRKIYIFSNGEFTASVGDTFCPLIEDPSTGETFFRWERFLTPDFVILDEYHNYIRPTSIRTKRILALGKAMSPRRMLLMSATPAEKVNDLRTFCILADTNFLDMKVDEESFSRFARALDKEPHRNNREGVKRARAAISSHIFSLPYVKPRFKAVNLVWLVDFISDAHKRIYKTAHDRYIEVCAKSGKNTSWGSFERFIELNNYRKTVEPLRAPHLAERAANNFRSGKLATAIGCAYKETVAEVVFQLVDRYNISRDNISIIWGGKRQYKTDDLLTREEIDSILKGQQGWQHLISDRQLLRRVRLTLKYLQDQFEHDEDANQQAHRHERLRELGLLGKQNDNTRQIEIDNFQDGTTKICIFTLASGGVGLSFDRDKEGLLPREGLFTPVYNGKEFQQVLGRLVRRASLSDANQYITMMRNTVEEFHVAPILDAKLKCIAEITNRSFDIIDLLQRQEPAEVAKLRDMVEAVSDAEKDDTIVTDFVAHKDEDDEKDDDDSDDTTTPEDLFKP